MGNDAFHRNAVDIRKWKSNSYSRHTYRNGKSRRYIYTCPRRPILLSFSDTLLPLMANAVSRLLGGNLYHPPSFRPGIVRSPSDHLGRACSLSIFQMARLSPHPPFPGARCCAWYLKDGERTFRKSNSYYSQEYTKFWEFVPKYPDSHAYP